MNRNSSLLTKTIVKRANSLLFFFFLLVYPACAASVAFTFEKVVIWGHKLHTHTHSYVHQGFFNGFLHMGYPTYWMDDNDPQEDFDFSNTLFLTEGQADQNIPLRADCFYILHNCTDAKYESLLPEQKIGIQVYTDDVLQYPHFVQIAPCCYYDFVDRVVYMPWATDLLPYQIDALKSSLPLQDMQKKIYWIGTIGDGKFGNREEIAPFIRACAENGVEFVHLIGVEPADQIQLIASSYMAPAIVGGWQQRQGYIPCRIFKNISYGKMGITNSYRVYELFDKKIVYHPDSYQLFFAGVHALQTRSRTDTLALMDLVRDRHTYLNRIELILRFFHLVALMGDTTRLNSQNFALHSSGT